METVKAGSFDAAGVAACFAGSSRRQPAAAAEIIIATAVVRKKGVIDRENITRAFRHEGRPLRARLSD
jgi:hypothetical protein